MKVMREAQIPLTYPLHYKRLLAFTTFPAWSTLHSTQFPLHLTVHHKLHSDQCADACLLAQQTTTLQTTSQYAQTAQMMKTEDDFQVVPLDDEHWTSEETLERTLCIHKHGLPHGLCQYPCPLHEL